MEVPGGQWGEVPGGQWGEVPGGQWGHRSCWVSVTPPHPPPSRLPPWEAEWCIRVAGGAGALFV